MPDTNKKTTRLLILFFLVYAVGITLFNLWNGQDQTALLGGIFLPLYLLVPPVAYKLFKLKPVYQVTNAIYIYCFFAAGIGIAGRLYHITIWYDKLVHCLAGYFFTFMGLGVYYLLKTNKCIEKDKECNIVLWFSASTSLMVGAIWEIFEYVISIVLGTDPQHVLDTGIHDTMQDMIACLIGSLIAIYVIKKYFSDDKKGPLIPTFEVFFQENIKK